MPRVNTHKLFAATLIAIASLALLAAGCSGSKDAAAPPPNNTGGPAFNFSFPATGASHQFKFTTAGSFAYHCIPHQSSGMTGTVIVDPASVVDSVLVQVAPGGALVFSPSTVTIDTNAVVRWVNVSSFTGHTVTRP